MRVALKFLDAEKDKDWGPVLRFLAGNSELLTRVQTFLETFRKICDAHPKWISVIGKVVWY